MTRHLTCTAILATIIGFRLYHSRHYNFYNPSFRKKLHRGRCAKFYLSAVSCPWITGNRIIHGYVQNWSPYFICVVIDVIFIAASVTPFYADMAVISWENIQDCNVSLYLFRPSTIGSLNVAWRYVRRFYRYFLKYWNCYHHLGCFQDYVEAESLHMLKNFLRGNSIIIAWFRLVLWRIVG